MTRGTTLLLSGRAYLLYAPVLFGASALLFLKGFAYARLFPVENFGLLNQGFLIASTFANFAGAGLPLLGHKMLPQYYTVEDQSAADDLLASATGVFAVLTAVTAAAMAVAIVAGRLDNAASFYAAVLCGAGQYLFVLRLIDIKSQLHFSRHARLSLVRAVLLLGLGVLVATTTRNVTLTLVCEGLVTLLLVAPAVAGQRGRTVLQKILNLPSGRTWFVRNFSAALRLLWLNGTLTVLYAVDRWAGVALLSQREYGIFALGLMVILLFETLQTVVNVSAFPLMGRMIARGKHTRAFTFASFATLAVVTVTTVCYLPFVFLLDWVVMHYLPAYADALTVLKLGVVAGALRLADFYASFSVLCNEERRLASIFGLVVAVFAVSIVAARTIGQVRFDPDGMMVVTIAVAAIGFLINLAVATHALRKSRRLSTA